MSAAEAARPLTPEQKAELARVKAMPDSEIDYSDIPKMTAKEMAEFRRPQRRRLVSVRLDTDVADWLQAFGPGYSTRINAILREVMKNAAGGKEARKA